MSTVSIVYHSGYGHTKRMAEFVRDGAAAIEGIKVNLLAVDAEGTLSEEAFASLNSSDGIIFGSPTYMGSVSWQFKKFADASSKLWATQAWKNKLAAGFTNSASMNGDKLSTLHYFFTLAMQHSMIFVGTGMLPANRKSSGRNDINYVASFPGAMAQTPSDASVEEMLPGDLETAKKFGTRFAEVVKAYGGIKLPA